MSGKKSVFVKDDEPSATKKAARLILGPLNPIDGYDAAKKEFEGIEELGSIGNAAKVIIDKLWGFTKKIGLGIWQFLSFLIDVVTGDAIATWGLAPYLALPGLLLFPIYAMVPGVESLITAPLGFFGVTAPVINYYQFISGFYFLFITIFNVVEGDKMK